VILRIVPKASYDMHTLEKIDQYDSEGQANLNSDEAFITMLRISRVFLKKLAETL
jgi:hypothetical protein